MSCREDHYVTRVVWVEVDGNSEKLLAVHREIDDLFGAVVDETEDAARRPFSLKVGDLFEIKEVVHNCRLFISSDQSLALSKSRYYVLPFCGIEIQVFQEHRILIEKLPELSKHIDALCGKLVQIRLRYR